MAKEGNDFGWLACRKEVVDEVWGKMVRLAGLNTVR